MPLCLCGEIHCWWCHNDYVEADSLARTLQRYLAEARDAVVIEDGVVCFELARARYTISAEHGKCVLHLWSDERNTVRRVVGAEEKGCGFTQKVKLGTVTMKVQAAKNESP